MSIEAVTDTAMDAVRKRWRGFQAYGMAMAYARLSVPQQADMARRRGFANWSEVEELAVAVAERRFDA